MVPKVFFLFKPYLAQAPWTCDIRHLQPHETNQSWKTLIKSDFYFSKFTETRPDEYSQKKKKIKMLPFGGDFVRHFKKSPCSRMQCATCTVSRADVLWQEATEAGAGHPHWCFFR